MNVKDKMHLVAYSNQYCKKCRRQLKGEMFIVPNQPIKALTGGNAFPVVWFCPNNYHHVRRLGFTKPVDFEQNLGSIAPPKDGLPNFTDSDDIWEEYMMEETKKEDALRKQMIA